jgi:site-specific recombinase XerD
MFQRLFACPHSIQRYLASPLLTERLQYLRYLAEDGAARKTLQGVAHYQLILVDQLNLSEVRTITRPEIEAAAERWACYQAVSRGMKKDAPTSEPKATFIRHATRWLDFLGLLEKTVSLPHRFTDLISEFANSMYEERGLSARTIHDRCREVEVFLMQLCDQQQLALSDLTITHLDDALLYRISQGGYARSTVKRQATAVRTFLRYAEHRGWCQCGLANAIKAPRIFRHETLPFSPTWEDVHRLLAGAGSTCQKDIRDRAILLLLAVYGLRAGEVRKLRLDDLDWEHELLHVKRVKRGPVQQLPLSQTVGEAILRYLREVRPRSPLREVFLTLCAPLRPLTSQAITKLVVRRWRPLGVSLEHYGSHSLRHACATRLINEGVSLKEIGDQLGHRDLDTTRIYAKVDLSHLREVADLNFGGLSCD